ncbi:MAG: hypothetical protein JNK04_17810 [Myxococcales bacterium]|nr:hypothetical protein [Myxococcales bacterium]
MGLRLLVGWALVATLSACRSIDIEPAGGGGATAGGGSPPAGAGGSGGTPSEGGNGGNGGAAPTCELCGNECVDLASDENNCGVCGETCLVGCDDGACTISNGGGVRNVAFEQGYLYWIQVNAVWRSFHATSAPTSKSVTENQFYYDLAVENERAYLTYVGGPPRTLDFTNGVEETAVCPNGVDCNGAQVQPLTTFGLDGVAWTSNTGAYLGSPHLAEVQPFSPGVSFAIGTTKDSDQYAWGTQTTVEFFPASPALTGLTRPLALAFAGTTLFVSEQSEPPAVNRISCSAQPWQSSQLLIDVVGALWLEATDDELFAAVNPPAPAPSQVLRMPASCDGPLDPADVMVIAEPPAPCKIGGIALDETGDRVYWSQYADANGSECSGVFSRHLSAPTLGTLADP